MGSGTVTFTGMPGFCAVKGQFMEGPFPYAAHAAGFWKLMEEYFPVGESISDENK